MSWEAVTWANKQRLKKSYEQIVLLVLANCADPNGEAFVKWPGRDHWWVYLSDHTRLPKSSLFRHLNTLVALGLGTRSELVMADGSRRPTFTLNMAATFDIDLPEDAEKYQAVFAKASPDSQSPRETEHDEDAGHDETDSDINTSQGDETSIAAQSPVGTGNPPAQSPVGTGPFPVLRLQEDSLAVPKDSPLPPSGGLAVRDELWEQFVASWTEPIPKMQLARSAWDHVETARRAEVVAAARGYWIWLKAHPKPPSAQSAQSFIRDPAGWAQWLRYAPMDGSAPSPVGLGSYQLRSAEGRAIAALYEIVGKSDFFHAVKAKGGQVYHANPVTPRVRALADAPPRAEWKLLDRQQAAAWDGFIAENIQLSRSRLQEGAAAPWPWPPRKDGTLSPVEETLTNE